LISLGYSLVKHMYGNTQEERSVTFRKIPDTEYSRRGAVWVVAGPGWKAHLNQRITDAMGEHAEIAWIGTGTLVNRIPPSGVLATPRRDLAALISRWKHEYAEGSLMGRQRVLIVEDPQAAGVWSEMVKMIEWQDLIESAKEWGVRVLIGTGVALPRAGMLIHNVDWFLIRSGGGPETVAELTSGAGVGDWLDSIGREVFEDVRIYRKILGAIGQKYRDTALFLSSSADMLTDRVFWWDPQIENHHSLGPSAGEETSPVASSGLTVGGRRINPRAGSVGGGAATRIVRKLGAVIELLAELKEDLESVFGEDGGGDVA
jgi:hypothetical protein